MRTKCLIAESICAEGRRRRLASARFGLLDPAPQRTPWLTPAFEALRRRLGRLDLPKAQPALLRLLPMRRGQAN